MKAFKTPIIGTALAVAMVAAAGSAQAGDAAAGKKVFKQCAACHTVKEGKNRVGPSLYGVIGRESGSAPKFRYSKAMKALGITWTEGNIAKYLMDPKGFVPKNKMAFNGLTDQKDIADVLAYIAQESGQ